MTKPELNQIHFGHALNIMRIWPDNFVDTVITSPPYYLMRGYGTEPQIWDGLPDCDHDWSEIIPNKKMDSRDPVKKISQGAIVGSSITTSKSTISDCGCFCQKCGAWKGELGSEPTVHLFIDHLTEIFTEVYRILKPSGSCFVNLDDCYASQPSGHKTIEDARASSTARVNHREGTVEAGWIDKRGRGVRDKSLFQVPERFGLAMTDRIGFIKRNRINWLKRSAKPESAKDRWTRDFEDIGFYTKEPDYYYVTQRERSVGEWQPRSEKILHTEKNLGVPYNRAGNPTPGLRLSRATWDVNTDQNSKTNNHYATYPHALVERPIAATCPEHVCVKCGSPIGETETRNWSCKCDAGTEPGLVFDPFSGTGTTSIVAYRMGRNFIGTELQEKYHSDSTAIIESNVKARLFR